MAETVSYHKLEQEGSCLPFLKLNSYEISGYDSHILDDPFCSCGQLAIQIVFNEEKYDLQQTASWL